MYASVLQVFLYVLATSCTNTIIQGNDFIAVATYKIIDKGTQTRIIDNLDYNPVGFVQYPVSGISILDNKGWVSGTGSVASNTVYTVWQSGAIIYGNATTATTVTAMSLNGKDIAPVFPLIVVPGQTFNITYSGGVPLVFKR